MYTQVYIFEKIKFIRALTRCNATTW